MTLTFAGCSGENKKPTGFDDPMPEMWENGYSWSNSDLITTDLAGVAEVTIGIDEGYDYVATWMNTENLENIFVEDGHPIFASENGVLYSKSFETLVRWPAKKPVTQPKETIKYFAQECYYQCGNMPENFEMPDGTISIGGGGFAGSSLTKLHIKQNVKTVERSAIRSETLKTIEISSPIVYQHFFNSEYVEMIIFNEGVQQIRPNGYFKKRTDVGTPSNPEYEWTIFDFSRLIRLSSVEFPSTLTAIGDVYFPVNFGVETYTLRENINYLSENAFHNSNISNPSDGNNYRKFRTSFENLNDYTQKYINKKMLKWDENWQSL